jgi:hypothetical protein
LGRQVVALGIFTLLEHWLHTWYDSVTYLSWVNICGRFAMCWNLWLNLPFRFSSTWIWTLKVYDIYNLFIGILCGINLP